MFEADLWNVDSLSSANFFGSGTTNIGVQWNSFPAPVPSGKAIIALQKHSRVSSSSARRLYKFVMAGGEKLIGKTIGGRVS